MNYYNVFYGITLSDSIKRFFDISSTTFSWLAVLAFLGYVISSIYKASEVDEKKVTDESEEKKNPSVRSAEMIRKLFSKLLYTFLPIALITWTCYVFTPTKKDCLLIVAGGAVGNFITSDTSSRAIPSDITKFLHLSLNKEIEDLSKEVKSDIKKELGIQTPKDKLLDKVEKLTKDELIEFLKNDSTILSK